MTNVELCRLNPSLPFCKLIPQEQFVPGAGGGGGGFETRNNIASRDTRTAAIQQAAPQVFIPPDPNTLKEVAKKVGFAPKDDVKPETVTETPKTTDAGTKMDGVESLAETDPRIERVASEARGPVPTEFPAIPQEAQFTSQYSDFMGIQKSASLNTHTVATSGDMDFRSALRRDFGTQAAAKDGTVAERIDATETPPTVVRGPRPSTRLFDRGAQRASKLENLSKYEPEYRSVLRNQLSGHLARGGPRAIDTGERGFVERFNSAFAPETESELATRNNMAMMNRGLPQLPTRQQQTPDFEFGAKPSEAAQPDAVAPPPAPAAPEAAAGAEAAEATEIEGIAEIAAF